MKTILVSHDAQGIHTGVGDVASFVTDFASLLRTINEDVTIITASSDFQQDLIGLILVHKLARLLLRSVRGILRRAVPGSVRGPPQMVLGCRRFD